MQGLKAFLRMVFCSVIALLQLRGDWSQVRYVRSERRAGGPEKVAGLADIASGGVQHPEQQRHFA